MELNVRFDLGLEYASFAYVDDPTNQNNADLDTINVDNSRSPTFRISEISQAGGGVVVYVGVSAACGIDFDSYMPSIAFNLSYLTADGTACEETIRPEQGYASNVLSPVPRFTGSASPATANFTDLSTPNCITTNLTNITPGAGLTEAFFQVDNYGFDAGVTLSSLSVNGIAIPASDLNIDMTMGLVQAFIDGRTTPTYWTLATAGREPSARVWSWAVMIVRQRSVKYYSSPTYNAALIMRFAWTTYPAYPI